MARTFKRNILIGLGVSLAALIISSTASYISINKLLESENWVEHTTKVIQGLDNVISRLKDAETGQRGYLLTGDDVFLEPYNGSRDDVLAYFDQVRLLTADNADQQKDFPHLEQLIKKKYTFIDKTIADRRRGIPATVSGLLAGKNVLDSIRVQIRVMEQREQKLMITRTSKMNTLATYTPILIVFASLIALIVTYAFYRRMKNNLLDNQRLQLELEHKEANTERHIKVITDLAAKISKGNYDVRIKNTDFE